MHSDRWENLKEIYHAVLERPEGERPAFLAEACGNDDDLRAQIEAMLDARDDTSTIFRPMVRRSDAATARAPSAPKRIGRYEICRVIGVGGMGVVYEAVQDHPHRVVALKVMRHGVASRAAMKRFQHEAEILGYLQHPGIAQVHEAGTFDDGEGVQPYFAMELIRGRPLIEHAEAQRLGTRDRLTLFVEVCEAVQYAHRKGVIHRDLKPGNILVDENGEPKILDFGVARATDSDIQTTTLKTDIGQLIGTIAYMSPEQVAGDPRQLDTRSDVYSLGVVLYELLAGRLPHNLKERTIPEAVRIIREDEPTPLSSVSRVYRGDLATIVAKALQKERARRYQSASDLAGDIRRYLSDQPIVARPPSVAYQLRKFAKRNKAFVGGVAAVFVVLVGGIVTTSVALARESEQRSLAQQRERQAEVARDAEAEARDEAQQRQQEAEVALEQARRQATKAAVINEFLTEIITAPDPLWDFSEPDPTRRSGPDLTIAEATLDVLPLIDEAFRGYPDAEADTRLAIGRSFVGLSHFTEARKQLTRALALFIDLYGEEDVRTRDCQRVLGRALERLGKPQEAERLTTRSLNSCRRLLGEEHPETLLAKLELAQLLMDEFARASEAVALCREVLESPGAAARAGSWIELQAQGQLAFALRILFQMTEAAQLGRATLEALISRGAGESGLAIFVRIGLGNCALDMGDPVLAETYHRETLALSLRVVGVDSFMTAITRQIMASALVAQGRWAEAESVARMAYETHRKTLGEQEPYTKVSQLRVFISQIGQRPDDPDPWRQLKNLIDAGVENLAPEALQAINSLTRFLIDQGRLDDARTLIDWGSKFETLALEFPRPEPYEAMVLRARLECLSGRHEQGVKLLREARAQAAARLPEWNFSQVAEQAFCACEIKLDQFESAAIRPLAVTNLSDFEGRGHRRTSKPSRRRSP